MHACLLVTGENVEGQLKPFQDPSAFETRPSETEETPENPNAKYDWYVIGGRWKNMLELKNGRKVPCLFGLLAKEISKTHSASKAEIKVEPLLRQPPVSVLHKGAWEDAEFIIGAPPNEKWLRRFEEIFRSLPDDTKLTIVDYHA